MWNVYCVILDNKLRFSGEGGKKCHHVGDLHVACFSQKINFKEIPQVDVENNDKRSKYFHQIF